MVAGKNLFHKSQWSQTSPFVGSKTPMSVGLSAKAKWIDVDWAVPAVTTDLVGDVVQPPGSPGCSSPYYKKKRVFCGPGKILLFFL
jgi:hypothetical protein